METKTPEQVNRQFDYKSDGYNNLIENIKSQANKQEYCLLLLVGSSKGKKKNAFKQIKEQTGRDIINVDANTLITTNEKATRGQIDDLFKAFDAENSMIYMSN